MARYELLELVLPRQIARAATEAKATANDTSDVEAMISAEEETNAYERVLAVCENAISEYAKFLKVSWKAASTMKISPRTSGTGIH